MKNLTPEKVVTGFMIFITMTFLFPPFESVHPYGGGSSAGYSFILFPPKGTYGDGGSIVNTDMLVVEWVFALMLSAAAWILIKIRNRNE